MNSKLQQLEEILNKCIENGWEYKNKDTKWLFLLQGNLIVDVIEDELDYEHMISYNDLFSVESWLLQFVKRKIKKHYYTRTTTMAGMTLRSAWEDTMREYHAMQMSILPVEEKIEYFISNIDIDTSN